MCNCECCWRFSKNRSFPCCVPNGRSSKLKGKVGKQSLNTINRTMGSKTNSQCITVYRVSTLNHAGFRSGLFWFGVAEQEIHHARQRCQAAGHARCVFVCIFACVRAFSSSARETLADRFHFTTRFCAKINVYLTSTHKLQLGLNLCTQRRTE